jgi:hypothetical protein
MHTRSMVCRNDKPSSHSEAMKSMTALPGVQNTFYPCKEIHVTTNTSAKPGSSSRLLAPFCPVNPIEARKMSTSSAYYDVDMVINA